MTTTHSASPSGRLGSLATPRPAADPDVAPRAAVGPEVAPGPDVGRDAESGPARRQAAREQLRQRAVERMMILDTPPEERFDRLTRLAAAVFDVPIALVTLVDHDRQWFKSRHGLDLVETHRDISFCAHAVLREEVMVVPDTLRDSRFAGNPVVRGEPFVRFYAGYPISDEAGTCFGTLCLIDTRPRDLDQAQLGLLRDLGILVRREMCGC
jgi:GAF domain-containing protein